MDPPARAWRSGAAQMAMLFVRCRGGISHNPLEYASPEDIAAAGAATTVYLEARLLRDAAAKDEL